MIANKLLEIHKIIFSAGSKPGLVEVSGFLQEGGAMVVSGPSGSGKTTLLRVVARLKEAAQGEILFRGDSWRSFSPVKWRRMVHYLPQKPVIFDGTVSQNLARPFELGAVKKEELCFDSDKAVELMQQVLLGPELLDQDARTLSGGEASRMALIRAILTEPQVILMDEPLAALDRRAAAAVMNLVSRWLNGNTGRGILMVSHVGDFADLPRVSFVNLQTEEDNGNA